MNPSDVQILLADLQPEIVARSETTAPKTIASAAAVLERRLINRLRLMGKVAR